MNYKDLDVPCEWCDTMEDLTRHHVKDWKGIRTGEIQILCRSCHDKIEFQYRIEGRLGKHSPKYRKFLEKNKKEIDDSNIERLRPFYSVYPKFDDIKKGDGY